MNQGRWRDDSSRGFRFSENLLFAQLGYSLNEHASVWLGYVHDWIHPLDKLSYHENRPYEDFLWNTAFGDLKFTSRTRLEQRIRQDTGNTAVRARQMLQLSHPLHFIHDDLSAYVGDEVLGYLNTNSFGPTGFSENRAFAGLAFQFTKQLGVDLGYLGQYVMTCLPTMSSSTFAISSNRLAGEHMTPVAAVARVEHRRNGLATLQDYGKTDRRLLIAWLTTSRATKPAWTRDHSTPLSRHRHRLMAQAILLGLLTGAVAVCFHLALDYGEVLRNRIIDFARQNSEWGPWIVLILALAGVLLSAALVIRFAPEASGSGIPHLKIVLQGRRPFRWLRVLVIKFVSTVVGVTGGLVLGRGGPSVHMGGAVGQGVANLWPGKHSEDRTILVAAGGGAGLAAAFNAPLAGLVFVLEELEWRFASLEFFTAAIACLAADMVCRAVLGQYPAFHLAIAGTSPLSLLIAFVPLGILSALLGGLFNRSLLSAQRFIALTSWPRLVWWLALASMVTIVGWRFPELLGSGQDFVNGILEGQALPLETAALFFLIRFVLTIGSSSSGAAGGLFIPILVLGALLGWGLGETIQMLFPPLNVDPKLFTVVGMAAYFTAVVHAPLTGIVLIIEMTGNYALVLPLFISCFSALLVADWAGNLPIYEALLENDWRKDRFKRAT